MNWISHSFYQMFDLVMLPGGFIYGSFAQTLPSFEFFNSFSFVLLQNNFVYLFIMLSNIYASFLPLSIRISIIKMGLKLYRNKEMKNR